MLNKGNSRVKVFIFNKLLFIHISFLLIVFKFTLLYRYKNNISVFTIYYSCRVFTHQYNFIHRITGLHEGRGLSLLWFQIMLRLRPDLTIMDAVFIHDCDTRTSSLDLDLDLDRGLWLISPSL